MTIEVISFLLGGILIATAIVGGGFEIREIKMPHVGAGVRIVSLVVGSLFLMLGLGMWSISNPELLAEQATSNALMTGAQTQPGAQAPSQPEPQTRGATPVDVKTESTVVPQAASAWTEPEAPREPAFTGFTGDNYMSWEVEGIPISAAARFNGMNGMIRVGWTNPATGVQDEVIQDLVLQQDGNGVIFYQGLNPRDPSTQQLRGDYFPDRFRVVQSEQGWTIDRICDTQACWPVFVQ
jgi:hypothetical protein